MLIKNFPLLYLISSVLCDNYRRVRAENSLACPDNKSCIPVNYCQDIVTLLNDATLPIHRFRQAVCGYVGTNTKVCCNSPRDIGNFNPTHEHNSGPSPPRECGKSLVRSSGATLGSYPFLVRVGFININDASIKYSCTGTILNERTVLTTATCALASAKDYKLHSVLVGEFDTATDPDCNYLFCAHCSRTHNISYVVKHPSFHAESYDHNIALLRLEESIVFTLTTQPICYSDRQYITAGCAATLVGWGKLSHDQKDSTIQRELAMKLLQVEDCLEFINRGLSVELCAIGAQDPCSGYSGSPLIRRDGSGYAVIGMLSYGPRCDSKDNFPSVFVNIQKYARWISENS